MLKNIILAVSISLVAVACGGSTPEAAAPEGEKKEMAPADAKPADGAKPADAAAAPADGAKPADAAAAPAAPK